MWQERYVFDDRKPQHVGEEIKLVLNNPGHNVYIVIIYAWTNLIIRLTV